MALEVKEEVSSAIFYKNVNGIDIQESVASALVFQPVSSAMSPDSIMVDIEGIHSILTRNFTYYTPECLKKSVPYWTSPYERPVIMHHNDKDGTQIGRIKSVEFLENTRAKSPGLIFTCNIGDETGIKGVKNGTLSTVSLGAVIHKATCSICGQNIAAEGECEHQRGRKYDGKLCYWLMEEMEPKELSYVIVPSDRYANTIKIYKPKDLGTKDAKESYEEGGNNMSLFENIDLELTEPQAKESTEEVVETVEVTEAKDAETTVETQEAGEEVVNTEIEKEPKEEPKTEEPKEEAKEVEQESKEEPTKKEEANSMEDMSKEELIDKCKELSKQVSCLLEDIKYLKTKLDKERGIKESLELEVLQMKQVNKLHLAEQVTILRKELGLREESMDELMMMSEESLNSSIKTFMEFKESNTLNVNSLPKIESKALVDEKADNTIKESSDKEINNSNINYESQLNDWFKNIANRKFF